MQKNKLTLDDYKTLLSVMYGFVLPFEAQLVTLTSEMFDLSGRLKSNLLVADLEDLGVNTAVIPLCQNLQKFEDQSQALGGWYVMEGATMGGQIVVSKLDNSHTHNTPIRFYNSYGKKTVEKWRVLRFS